MSSIGEIWNQGLENSSLGCSMGNVPVSSYHLILAISSPRRPMVKEQGIVELNYVEIMLLLKHFKKTCQVIIRVRENNSETKFSLKISKLVRYSIHLLQSSEAKVNW